MYVKGVGPARAAMLEAKGLKIDRGSAHLRALPLRRPQQRQTDARARARARWPRCWPRSARPRFPDSAAATWVCSKLPSPTPPAAVLLGKWFHGAYLADVLTPGMKVALFGKVEWDSYSGGLAMMHPEYEIFSGDEDGDASIHTGRVVPIYEAAGQASPRAICANLLHRILESIEPLADTLPPPHSGRAQAAGPLERHTRTALSSGRFRSAPAQLLPLPGAVPADLRGVLLAGMRSGAEARQGPSSILASLSS